MSRELSLPWLLIATPQLTDPNFNRSVVLIVEHGPNGSMGFVLNRPTDVPLSELIDASDLEAEIDADLKAWFGGPVETRAGLVLAPLEGSDVTPGAPLAVTVSASESMLDQALAAPREGSPLYPFRFLVGYSGWGAGQLQEELMAGAWLQAHATHAMVFDTNWRELWERAMAALGATARTLVPTEHTYLN